MATLRESRDQGKLDQFAKDHETDTPGNEAVFNATLASMDGMSKAVPEHRLRTITTTEAILELLGIETKILRADAGVRALD
jgi:hypothetical protein